ncbi:Ppx/GppA phosphatase family protein [Shewanella sedimentimangrovi]|uniref:Exopolyphosphatase n=1 Tax=Shewanella sedimentimangrovi TaxID=2814293 RepID=A0ABX7QZC6_9GAMM|nr:exopolyphosphatase [Shewanella sedimentimangrovi]QSX36897.1 exopolyphosphatase [Shewanella sedimentimangrovi]
MQDLYAAITLGSNSFNMLVATTVAGQPKVLAKYKRKVRLAEGIGCDGMLSEEVMARGLDCLAMFAQMLKDHAIAGDRVAVVATATLRTIANAEIFKARALPILGHPIDVICGMREAELIYRGMVATTSGQGRRLVIDIGGASTEFIVGDGDKLLFKTSLPIGCVTYQQAYFSSLPLQQLDFDDAHGAVEAALGEDGATLRRLGWHCAVGASGTVQSVVELLEHRQESALITLPVLLALQQEILAAPDAGLSGINGLCPERAPTFAAGVAILLALFRLLGIEQLSLSGGALREGVLLELSRQAVAH